jgi:hypothetical protein
LLRNYWEERMEEFLIASRVSSDRDRSGIHTSGITDRPFPD